MKYKNIKLGQDEEDELLVVLELVNPINTIDDNKKIRGEIKKLTESIKAELFVEFVLDDMIDVRCWDKKNIQQGITFNQKGVELLKRIYDCIDGKLDAKVSIGITVGGYDMFKREDGSEYNEDIVSWDKFIEFLEY